MEALKTVRLDIGYKLKSKIFTVVSDINLSLNKGEVTALIGVNGSGKSTLIKTLLKQQPSLNGEIFIDNQDIKKINNKTLAKKIAFVSSKISEQNILSVKELIALGRIPYSSMFNVLSKKDKQIVDEVINTLRIKYLENRIFATLSDGEKQKVMIARALAQDTDVIILDEPTSHLDTPGKYELSKIIKNISVKQNKAILYSTHDIVQALINVDNVAFINCQKIYIDTPSNLVDNNIFKEMFKFSSISIEEQNSIIENIKQSIKK